MSIRSQGEKIARNIESSSVSLTETSDSSRFFYRPTFPIEFDLDSTNEYLRSNNSMFKKPIYNSEKIFFDSITGKWKLTPDLSVNRF
jgi:hypothetical protein